MSGPAPVTCTCVGTCSCGLDLDLAGQLAALKRCDGLVDG